MLARDAEVSERRFGVTDGSTGAVYTRTGRSFFPYTEPLLERVRAAVAPLFERLDTDWVALDCELLPWSAKALDLITGQYASVGAAARTALPEVRGVLDRARQRGVDVGDLPELVGLRLENAAAFRNAYAAYCRPTDGLDGITLAPFQVLAVSSRPPAGRASSSSPPTPRPGGCSPDSRCAAGSTYGSSTVPTTPRAWTCSGSGTWARSGRWPSGNTAWAWTH